MIFISFSHPRSVIDVLIASLAAVFALDIICAVTDADMFTVVRSNVVAAVTATLELTMTALLEEDSMAACWAIAVLICDRALQAWMPSNHV